MRAGSDVAVVGYNDVHIAAACELTTVRNPLKLMGSIAARMLLDVIAGRSAESVTLTPELVVRASSCTAPAPSVT